MAYSSYNQEEMISHIGTTMLGGNWLIKVVNEKPVPLREWINSNYKKGLTNQTEGTP